jgi:hypothetical protein
MHEIITGVFAGLGAIAFFGGWNLERRIRVLANRIAALETEKAHKAIFEQLRPKTLDFLARPQSKLLNLDAPGQ